MPDPRDYGPFFRFLQTYSAVGFNGIDPADPLILELENNMEKNDQYFIVGDMISMKILYCSNRCLQKIGVDPALITPYHFFEATHPDDLHRRSLSRSKVFKTAQDLFITGEGCYIMSSNFRMRNPDGIYENTLYQCYIYYNKTPFNSVNIFQLVTNIEMYKKNEGFHYYRGNDMNYFRYPDDELLKTGLPFSQREFEIIQLAGQSLSSEQIAEKLFLSTHTVNTHRRNILKKTGKTNISDLIYTLKEEGLM
jgi:DNA-binding CsgD family transcriptional regulator